MAKKSHKNKLFKVNKNLVVLLVVLAGLIIALVLFNAPEVFRRGSAALDPHLSNISYLAVQGRTPVRYASGPVLISPCSGNWNRTECFYVQNTTSSNLTLKYLLDCWDETKCTDKQATLTLTPGQVVQLGLGNVCSRWQLDLNWSGKVGWDWGGVVEASTNCPTPAPVTPAPVTPPPGRCNYTQFDVQ